MLRWQIFSRCLLALSLQGEIPMKAQAKLATASKREKEKENKFSSLIIREKEPENLEFPFSTLSSFITPGEQFFIRNHFPTVPQIKVSEWRLKIEGAVSSPF